MGTEPAPTERLARAIEAMPSLARVREAAGDAAVYLVGGGVRDILLGRARDDVDLVVEGDVAGLAERLGAEVMHERFGTAVLDLDGLRVDLAGARAETYSAPGALPDVRPAPLADDLARRDFTINAMAVPLAPGSPQLLDPHDGQADLEAGLLRVLHDRSFIDDPTRALRAARYAARLGFALEPNTDALLRAADLSTVSTDRVRAELRRLASEPAPQSAFEQAAAWGLIELTGGGEPIGRVADLLAEPPWRDVTRREDAILAAVDAPSAAVNDLLRANPRRPSDGVELAAGLDGVDLALARALGAEWLDRYLADWRGVRLEIDGEDLLDAGVPEGPAVGRGLNAALARKLDGEISGREQELDAALLAARGEG